VPTGAPPDHVVAGARGQRGSSGLPSSLSLVARVEERERGEGKAAAATCVAVVGLLCELIAIMSARDRESGESEARVRVSPVDGGFYTARSTR
jgi:hypothetical protein